MNTEQTSKNIFTYTTFEICAKVTIVNEVFFLSSIFKCF